MRIFTFNPLKKIQKKRLKAMNIFHEALVRLKESIDITEKETIKTVDVINKKKQEIADKEMLVNQMGVEKESMQKQISKIEEFVGE